MRAQKRGYNGMMGCNFKILRSYYKIRTKDIGIYGPKSWNIIIMNDKVEFID